MLLPRLFCLQIYLTSMYFESLAESKVVGLKRVSLAKGTKGSIFVISFGIFFINNNEQAKAT